MIMEEINAKLEELLQVIKSSPEYRAYREAYEKIHAYPEIEREVNEFRKRNFEIQQQPTEQIYDSMLQLQEEYAPLRRNSIVEEYLNAELTICRMVQDINWKIIRAIEFELGFEEK
ncbi:MAG: YlbF family regulator [Lachnospiraceae bacterium]